MTDDLPPTPPDDEAAPPFGGSWTRLYVLVAANLLFWIAVFAAFTRAFR